MRSNIQSTIVRLRNELKALKVASELAYSSMLLPANTPKINWQGNVPISYSGTLDNILRRVRFRFERTDSRRETPQVNFAASHKFSPSYKEFIATQGVTISGNDPDYVDSNGVYFYIAEAGENYVDFYADFDTELAFNFYTLSTIAVSIDVQAISLVQGKITAEVLV